MTLCYRSTRQEDVPVSSAVSVPDEMTPRNMPAPHKSQVFIELNFFYLEIKYYYDRYK